MRSLILVVVVLVVCLSVSVVWADWLIDPLDNTKCLYCHDEEENHGACTCTLTPHIGVHNSGEHVTCTINLGSSENVPTCDGCRKKKAEGGCGEPHTYGRCFILSKPPYGSYRSTAECGCVPCPPHDNCLTNPATGIKSFWVEVPVEKDCVLIGWAYDHHVQCWGSGMGGQYTNHIACNSTSKSYHYCEFLPGGHERGRMHCHQVMNYHNPCCGKEIDLTGDTRDDWGR